MKAYVKPELYYEDFQLSQSVMANACQTDGFWQVPSQDGNSCALELGGGVVLFNEGVNYACTTSGSGSEIYCYSNAGQVFSS